MNLLGKAMNASRQVLGHSSALDSLNTHPLQSLGESKDNEQRLFSETCVCDHDPRMFCRTSLLYKVVVAVEFAAVLQASGPSEDAGDGVGAGWSSLEVESKTI